MKQRFFVFSSMLFCTSLAVLVSVMMLTDARADVALSPQVSPSVLGRIESIRVEGQERIEPETIKSYITLKVGDIVTAGQVSQSIKALYATELFTSVSIDLKGDVLEVKVKENPIINRVAFEGNRKIDTKDLEGEVQIRPRSVYNLAKVQGDVKRLLDVYRRNGRFAVTVDPKIIRLEQNRVDLVFEINEGKATGIGRIDFVGNKAFSAGSLRDVLQTKESAWFRFLSTSDRYDPDQVSYDRELLRNFYLKEGYADFRVVSVSVELSRERNEFYITFTLDEGERYKFGEVDVVTSLKKLDVKKLRDDIWINSGDWYDGHKVDEVVSRLTAEVGNLGYAFVDVDVNVKRNRDEHVLGVIFDIREGPKVYVERIDVAGNVRTRDEVIRRQLLLAEGDAYSAEKLRRSEKSIRDLGFFKTVEVTNKQGSAPDKTVIQIKVEEQSTGQFNVGAGYSTVDGVLGRISLGEHNLLGRGLDLNINTTIAMRRQEYDISFTDPYFLNRPLALGVDLFSITRDLQLYSSFNSQTTGGATSIGYRLGEDLNQTLRYTLRKDRISNIPSTASVYVREQAGSYLSSIVSQDLVYDRTDDRIFPTKGYRIGLSNDLSGIGGDVRYLRTLVRGLYAYPLTTDTVLSLRGQTGYIAGINQIVRINDRFFLGDNTMRGFEFGSAGPRDVLTNDALGGNTMYTGTVEVSVPLGLPREVGIMGRVFTDFGTVSGVEAKGPAVRDSKALRAAAGVGISWKSPIGLLGIDLAQPYIRESYDRPELFRFNFGVRF